MAERKTAPLRSTSPGLGHASTRSTHDDAKKGSCVAPPPRRPRIAFLDAVFRMTNQGELLFDDGNLVLKNPKLLVSEVLPRYFKPGTFSSFQRQLYYFGFRKIVGKGKLEPQVFYNYALKGKAPEALLDLQRRSNAAKNVGSTLKVPVTQQPLSKYQGLSPDDIAPLSNNACPTSGRTESSVNKVRKINRDRSPFSRRSCFSAANTGRDGGLDAGGDEVGIYYSGDVPSLAAERESSTTESDSENNRNAVQRDGRTFCGWQSPLRNKKSPIDGGDGRGGGSIEVSAEIDSGKYNGRTDDGGKGGDRRGNEEETLPTAMTKRKISKCNGQDASRHDVATNNSIQDLFTTVQVEIGDHNPGRRFHDTATATPQPLRKRGSSGSSTVRNCSARDYHGRTGSDCPLADTPPTLALERAASMPPADHLVRADHVGTPSVTPTSTARKTESFRPASALPDVGVENPFRRRLQDRDADFEGKNFGDSILGEYRATENTNAVVGRHVWSMHDRCNTYAGDGADDVAASSRDIHLGCAGEAVAPFGDSVANTAMFSKGAASPNQLPLTPSPLSLSRPAHHSMQNLLGL